MVRKISTCQVDSVIGLRVSLVSGSSHSGVWNTDDFLCRLIKGCVQLGLTPFVKEDEVRTLANLLTLFNVSGLKFYSFCVSTVRTVVTTSTQPEHALTQCLQPINTSADG